MIASKKINCIKTVFIAVVVVASLSTVPRAKAKCCGGERLDEGEECCDDVGPYKPEPEEDNVKPEHDLDDGIKEKINDFLNKLPGPGNIEVDDATWAPIGEEYDCCPHKPGEGPVLHGVHRIGMEAGFSVKLVHYLIYPQPPHDVDWGTHLPFGLYFRIKGDLGIYFTLSTSWTGRVGWVNNKCAENGQCAFGEVEPAVAVTLGCEASLQYGYRWPHRKTTWNGVECTFVGAKVSGNANISLNKDGDCGKGLDFSGQVDPIELYTDCHFFKWHLDFTLLRILGWRKADDGGWERVPITDSGLLGKLVESF
jgi:hypothetical protein